MSVLVETVSAQSFEAEQICQIVNEVLARGQYEISESTLAFQDHVPPVVVAALERIDRVAPGKIHLITDLATGVRYNFLAQPGDERVECEAVGMSCLNEGIPIDRLPMLRFDELSCHWGYWNSPEEEPELNTEGALDPLMFSIVSKLRK